MIVQRGVRKDFLRSQTVVRKRRKQRMMRWSIRASLLIVLLISVALLSQIEFFAIRRVVISGNSNIPSEQIQEIVDKQIHTSYIGLFPKTNVFLYPKGKINDSLLSAFPRIKSVNIYTESFNFLNVRIEERVPIALWCSAHLCYVADESAYIYAEARVATEGSIGEGDGLVSITGLDEVAGSKPIGVQIIEQEAFSKILQVANDMRKNNLMVDTVEFRSKDEVNFWIGGKDQAGPKKKIIFSSRKDYVESYGNLTAALKSKALSTTTDFEYIDTRFGNKVFYRLTPSKVSTTTPVKSKK